MKKPFAFSTLSLLLLGMMLSSAPTAAEVSPLPSVDGYAYYYGMGGWHSYRLSPGELDAITDGNSSTGVHLESRMNDEDYNGYGDIRPASVILAYDASVLLDPHGTVSVTAAARTTDFGDDWVKWAVFGAWSAQDWALHDPLNIWDSGWGNSVQGWGRWDTGESLTVQIERNLRYTEWRDYSVQRDVSPAGLMWMMLGNSNWGSGSGAVGGWVWSFDALDLVVYGETQPVPEPSSLFALSGILSITMASLFGIRRRRA